MSKIRYNSDKVALTHDSIQGIGSAVAKASTPAVEPIYRSYGLWSNLQTITLRQQYCNMNFPSITGSFIEISQFAASTGLHQWTKINKLIVYITGGPAISNPSLVCFLSPGSGDHVYWIGTATLLPADSLPSTAFFVPDLANLSFGEITRGSILYMGIVDATGPFSLIPYVTGFGGLVQGVEGCFVATVV